MLSATIFESCTRKVLMSGFLTEYRNRLVKRVVFLDKFIGIIGHKRRAVVSAAS
jgi:hypothetical protein